MSCYSRCFIKNIVNVLLINIIIIKYYTIFNFVTATEEKFELAYRKKIIDDKDGVEITCMAEGLYPQPTLDISIE